MNLPDLVRFPSIPLSYDKKEEASPGEMVINYATGDIYVASPNDRTVLIDITAAIKAKIANLQGDDVSISIPDIGVVKLTATIISIINKLDNEIEIDDIGTDNINYLPQPGTVDKKTISQLPTGAIQVIGFDQAPTNGIFTKNSDGVAEWKTISQIAEASDNDPSNNPNNKDGKEETVPSIEATNNKIYLRTDTRQKTTNPQQSQLAMVIPPIIDDYGRIDWLLKLGNNIPTLKFDTNVIFQYAGYYQPLTGNNYYLYKFETYDNGATWLGTYKPFNQDINTSDASDVKLDYLNNNYYNKTQVDKLITIRLSGTTTP